MITALYTCFTYLLTFSTTFFMSASQVLVQKLHLIKRCKLYRFTVYWSDHSNCKEILYNWQ